jgi:hypothetical protein
VQPRHAVVAVFEIFPRFGGEITRPPTGEKVESGGCRQCYDQNDQPWPAQKFLSAVPSPAPWGFL